MYQWRHQELGRLEIQGQGAEHSWGLQPRQNVRAELRITVSLVHQAIIISCLNFGYKIVRGKYPLHVANEITGKVQNKKSRSLYSGLLCKLPVACVHESPGKNTGMGCHAVLQGIFPTLGIKPASPEVPAVQVDSLSLSHGEALLVS